MARENYLMSMFRLDEQGTYITRMVLAEHLKTLPAEEGLGTSLPSVGAMLGRMAREGLVDAKANKEVVLTARGRRAAEGVVRRHRLAERLVVDLLGMEMHLAHIEAHRLEHAISPALENQIAIVLNNPEVCPFGHPIPGSKYVPNPKSVSLDVAPVRQDLIVDHVPEDDQVLLVCFVEKNILPGHRVRVWSKNEATGVITLKCEDGEVKFSYEVASEIHAHPA